MVCKILILLLITIASQALDYYVDFDTGSDTANGITTTTSWKHAPSDINASGVAASAILIPGDSVNFKGGVSYLGSITPTWNGSEGNPITWRTGNGWGTGKAILDGRVSAGNTNEVGIDMNGKFNRVDSLNIGFYLNFVIRLYDSTPNNFTLTNCIVHDAISLSTARCITINNCSDTLIVSNIIHTSALKLLNGNNLITNLVIYGNNLYDSHDDAINVWAWGYTVINGNYIHDLIEDGNHSDAMQILGFPPGSPLVVANNLIVSSNTQAIFIEPFNATDTGSSGLTVGQVYQVVTNSLYPGGSTSFTYNGNTYQPGEKFTVINGVTVGTWNGTAALLKEYFPAGKAYIFNNIVRGIADGFSISGIDTYTEVEELWCFNNVFDHATQFSGDGRDIWCAITNVYSFNNYIHGTRALNFVIVGDETTERVNASFHDGWNQYTNSANGNLCFSTPGNNNLHSLAEFQIAEPGHEVNTVIRPMTFVDSELLDYHPLNGYSGGTNLTGISINFNMIPALWRPDPTKDRGGVQRPSLNSWSIGAFEADSLASFAISGRFKTSGNVTIK